MCYSCEVTFNSMGQLVGWGDMSCLDHPEERHLQVKMHAHLKYKNNLRDKSFIIKLIILVLLRRVISLYH